MPRYDEGGRFNSNGYGDWKFSRKELRKRAEALACSLPAVMAELQADFIAVRGTSGTFIAGALQMYMDVPVLLMRKRGEASHGCFIEGNDHHLYRRGIVLDDFICTGSTVEGMIDDLKRDGQPVRLVAIVEHDSAGRSGTSLQPRTATCLNVRNIPVYTFK